MGASMKRIGLLFLVLLMLSACGTEQVSDFAKSGASDAQKTAAHMQRQLERQQAKLQRARREARQAARAARRTEARRLAQAAAQEEAEQQAQTLAAAPTESCDYDPCLPPASDYDCEGGSGDGPAYTGYVRVVGSDPYGLDSDGDGVACES